MYPIAAKTAVSDEGVQALEGASRSTVTLDMPPPQLVVEVVSPGSINRDYRYKLSQYQARGIPEYWIVDPMKDRVTLLVLVDGLYESRVFTGEDILESPFLQEMGGDTPAQALRDHPLQQFSLLCGTFRSPQPPLKKGAVKVPLFKGDLGRSFPTVPHYRAKRCICRSSVER